MWHLCIDTGGTFTDCHAVDPDGRIHRAKVLSTSALRGRVFGTIAPDMLCVSHEWKAPSGFLNGMRVRLPDSGRSASPDPEYRVVGFDAPGGVIRLDQPVHPSPPMGAMFEVLGDEEAPILAAHLVTGTRPGTPLPPIRMRLGTTRATNALLERRGTATALFITRGFRDLLTIGTQQRPDLFALDIRRPPPLHEHTVEVDERLSADGTVLRPLDPAALDAEIERLVSRGVHVAAIALMHAWRNPAHEQALAAHLRARGFTHVSASADLSPAIGFLGRSQTAVVDAYLAPAVAGYLERVHAGLATAAPPSANGPSRAPAPSSLHIMTSAGGLVSPRAFRPKDALLSGPVGGVLGAARAARRSGIPRIIALDMGGTSTDVSRVDTAAPLDLLPDHAVGDARIMAPALAIESVAAGGGSICAFDGHSLTVGPRSAGASPGPACYGAGGPVTITDINLLAGRLDPARFDIPIDPDPARVRLEELRAGIRSRTAEARNPSTDDLIDAFLDIAGEHMAGAIRRISIRRGYDPAVHALVAFGGAGAQHACDVAARLGIRTVVIPADAGVLSALGLGHAPIERSAQRQILSPLADAEPGLPTLLAELAARAAEALAAEGVPPPDIHIVRRTLSMRFAGQESAIPIDLHDAGSPPGQTPAPGTLAGRFAGAYRAIYGHVPESRPVELESVRVVASTRPGTPEPSIARAPASVASPVRTTRVRLGGKWTDTPVYHRADLPPGATLSGPALILEPHTTTVIAPGWSARIDGAGAIVLEHVREPPHASSPGPAAAQYELDTARLLSIAHDMGEMLQRTALSTNVRERLDFSCAILDPGGELIVNAPHIPVHLGALGVCVRALREQIEMGPGDVVVTNHPALGGSHLPDITVVTPVYGNGRLLAYVASRAHHAEIGGTRPGSMPTDARTLAEEGVVIPPMHLVRAGVADWNRLNALLTAGPHPSRAPADNLADLAAQVAANHRGFQALFEFASAHGPDRLLSAMEALKDRAEQRTREALALLEPTAHAVGAFTATELLDDGSPLVVSISIANGRATIDFTGSAPGHAGNLNATPAIVRSAVIYALRLLIRDNPPLPLNEGIMRCVDLRIPRGILDPVFDADPSRCPAVAGGNTETSQKLVNALIRALGLAADSQGTMNNVVFGNDRFGYYETVCGGAGAGPGFHGASAVHTHMTNTRITDPEVLEHRFPVRLERFEIRRGSGGAGQFRGGDGVIREITFLEPCSLSLLTQNRAHCPRGLAGGGEGHPGSQHIAQARGGTRALGSIDGCEVTPGDRLLLQTPGGGGFGAAPPT